MAKKQFIGDRKVTSVLEEKDGDRVVVVLEGGRREVMSRFLFGLMVTEKPIDLNELRDRVIHPAVQEMFEVFVKYDIKTIDFEYALACLGGSLQHNIARAERILWKVDPQYELRMSHIMDVLETAKAVKETKEEAPKEADAAEKVNEDAGAEKAE